MKPSSVFEPLPWQVEPWKDTSPVLLLTGSAGGGKSKLAAEKVHGFCLKYPGATGVILRKTRDSLSNSTLLFFERKVIGSDHRIKHVPSKHRFEYPNGSLVAYGGMADQQQREQIRSIGQDGALDIAWMEEAIQFAGSDYNELLGRMRGKAAPWNQIIITTNPGPPLHWIYKDLIQGKGASVYYSNEADNKYNPEAYKASLARMTGLEGKRLREGLWVQAEGTIYDEWNPAIHVCERDFDEFPYLCLAADDGYSVPAALLWVGIDYDKRLHVFQEFYEAGHLHEELAAIAQSNILGRRPQLVVCDAAAASLVAAMTSIGLPALGHKGLVADGISLMHDMLKLDDRGQPRLTVSSACVHLISEIESYVWRNESKKDAPLKVNDHALDALRYLVHYLFSILELEVVQTGMEPVVISDAY